MNKKMDSTESRNGGEMRKQSMVNRNKNIAEVISNILILNINEFECVKPLLKDKFLWGQLGGHSRLGGQLLASAQVVISGS